MFKIFQNTIISILVFIAIIIFAIVFCFSLPFAFIYELIKPKNLQKVQKDSEIILEPKIKKEYTSEHERFYN